MMGFVGTLEVYLGRETVFVQTEARLFLLDGECAVSNPLGTKLEGQVVEGQKRLDQSRVAYGLHSTCIAVNPVPILSR